MPSNPGTATPITGFWGGLRLSFPTSSEAFGGIRRQQLDTSVRHHLVRWCLSTLPLLLSPPPLSLMAVLTRTGIGLSLPLKGMIRYRSLSLYVVYFFPSSCRISFSAVACTILQTLSCVTGNGNNNRIPCRIKCNLSESLVLRPSHRPSFFKDTICGDQKPSRVHL